MKALCRSNCRNVYPNVIINGKVYSLPMQELAVNVSQEEA